MANALLKAYRDSLASQGLSDDRDDLVVMRDYLVPLADKTPELYSAYPDFDTEAREVRQADAPGTVRGLVNTAKTAFQRTRQAMNTIGGVDAEDVASLERDIQARPASVPWGDWQRTTGKDAVKVFLRDPIEITANIIASGFAGSLPAIGAGLVGGAGGAALGGPTPLAAVTGTIGAAVGTGAGSLATEYGSKYLDVLRDAGADLADADSIRRTLEDPEVRTRARSLAFRRGIPVAVFDAASAGLAGKFFKGLKGATTGQVVRRGLAEAGVQGALGGAGEVAGALSAGEKISPGAVFEEVVGELGPGAAEVAGAAMRRRISAPAAPATAETSTPPASPTTPLTEVPVPPTPTAPVARSNARIVTDAEAMDDATAAARLAELRATISRTDEEETEFAVLSARAPSSPPASSAVTPPVTPPPVAAGAPVESPASGIAAAPTPTATAPTVSRSDMQPARQPDSDYLYTVQREQPHSSDPTLTIPGYVQIDPVVNQGRGEPLTDAQRAALPQPPDWLPTGSYTLAQITDAIAKGPPTNVVATAPAPEPVPDIATPIPPKEAAPIVAAQNDLPKPTEIPPVVPSTTPTPQEVVAAKSVEPVVAPIPVPAAVVTPVPPVIIPAPVEPQPGVPEPAKPFPYGAIVLGEPSLDFREFTEPLRPEQWEMLIAQNLKHPQAAKGDKEGKRAMTRVALVMQEPHGEGVVMAGIVVPQAGVEALTGTAKIKGPALQRMGVGPKTRVIEIGGDQPIAVRDAVQLGFKPLAVVHFTGEPTKIFQRFPSVAEFDRTFAATEKTAGTARQRGEVTRPKHLDQQARTAQDTEAALDAQINKIGAELQAPGLTEARETELNQRLIDLFERRSKVLRSGQSQTGDSSLDSARGNTPITKIDPTAPNGARFRNATPNEISQSDIQALAAVGAFFTDKLKRPIVFTAVEPDTQGTYRGESGAAVAGRRVPTVSGAPVEDALGALRRNLETLFGKRILFFTSDFPIPSHGLSTAAHPDTVLVNAASPVTFSAVFGHELGHDLKNQNPQLYQHLAEWVQSVAPMPQAYTQERARLGYTPDEYTSEYINDVIGDRFSERQFWDALGREARTKGVADRFRQLLAWIGRWLGLRPAALEKRGDLSEETRAKSLPQIERIREAVAQAVIEFTQNEQRDIAFQTGQLPIAATRSNQFSAVVGRLQAQGARVDVFTQEFFRLGVRTEVEAQIAQLQQRLAGATTESQRRGLNREIARRQERLAEVELAQGASFGPWHISLAVDDVQNATVGNLVTLLHEASEALGMRLNPVMKGRLNRAIDNSLTELQKRRDAAAVTTGVTPAAATGAFDLLSETLAQQLAAEGVPAAPNLARAILNWIKDIYYRTAMALQAAFGAQPSDEMALDWFENQLERIVGGDYDYRFARLLDRFLPESMPSRLQRFERPSGTPGSIADYWNPFANAMEQPFVIPDTAESAAWNLAFQTVPAQSHMPDPEARAHITGAAWNKYIEHLEAVRHAANVTQPWAEWWKTLGSAVGDDPMVMLASLASSTPGAEQSKVGSTTMTPVTNGLAALEARRLIENFEAKVTALLANSKEQIKTEADAVIEASREVNRIEKDRRNSELQEGLLQKRIKDLVSRFVRDNATGYRLAEQQGALAEAVAHAETLAEGDEIPAQYQQVFKSILDGNVPVFDYVRAIAELDLDLTSMTQAEVVKAIRDSGASSAVLAKLAKNKPLLNALAVLAHKNAGIVDEINLGWIDSDEEYRKIHDELQVIRNASVAELRDMLAAQDERVKAVGLRERLKRDYLKRRRPLQATRERIQRAQARVSAVDPLVGPLNDAVEQAQAAGSEAPSEWAPVDGAEFMEMHPTATGWTKTMRVLHTKTDGSWVDGDTLRASIGRNKQWLEANVGKRGQKTWESVNRQTMELAAIDIQAKNNTAHARAMDTYLAPLMTEARNLGGVGPQVAQRLAFFQHIRFANKEQVFSNSKKWEEAWRAVQKSTGIQDNGLLQAQIYDPVSYMLNTEPGMDEAVAIREATRMARARLAKPLPDTFNAAFERLLRTSKTGFETLVGIAESNGAFVKDPALKSDLRRTVARGWLTSMRSIDGGLVQRLMRDMEKLGWRVTREKEKDQRGRERVVKVKPATFRDLDTTDAANDAGLVAVLERLFPDPVVRDWLTPFINKGGTEVFTIGKKDIPGSIVREAWIAAGQNAQNNGQRVLMWIDLMGAQAGVAEEAVGEENPLADFRLSILRQLDSLFAMELKMAYDASQTRNMFDPFGTAPHVVMDARTNDQIPPEHLNFTLLDDQTSGMLLAEIAFHAAFGRNGQRMTALLDDWKRRAEAAEVDYQGLQMTTHDGRVAEAAVLGWKDFKELENLARIAHDLREFQKKLEAFMGVGSAGGPFDGTSRVWMTLLNFMSGQIVDNPKTAFYNVLNLAQTPFAQRSLGPEALRTVTDAFISTARTGFGSLLEAMHLHLMHASAEEMELTQALGSARTLPWDTLMSQIGPQGRQGWKERMFIKPLQAIRYAQNKGVGLPFQGAPKEFPRAAVVPGLGVSNAVSQVAAVGGMMAQVRQLRRMMTRGANYFSTHRGAMADLAFRFKAKDLGMGRWDQGVFDWWRVKSVEYGLGTLEDLIRSAMPAMAKGERIITRDQLLRVAGAVATEVNGDSSINTMPGILITHPMLRTFFPLLRWPFWAMHKTWENLGSVEGRRDWKTYATGLATLAMWSLPIGLAFTFALDEYDDKLLGKKSNFPAVGPLAALPFIGPLLEAITSDRTVPQTLAAYAVRGARAGNLGGIAGDVVGQIMAPTDAASGRRTFSLDQRVLVMSQLLNLQQAVSNAVNQDWTTTWSSFWHPLFRAVGGNSALHSLDLVNNVLGLDNAESRAVTRINASNWLRASAAELNIELRPGGGGAPTPMSVHTRSMLEAAMAGDRIGFMESYRAALEAARKVVASDPSIHPIDREREAERRVLAGWRGRDPLAIFGRKPTEFEVRRLLTVMDASGAQEVKDALNRYNEFSRLIRVSPEQAKERAMEKRLTRPALPNAFRSTSALAPVY